MLATLGAVALSLGIAPQASRVPAYGDFPTRGSFTGSPAAPDLASAKRAAEYRTVLRRGAAVGPNFAGRYTVVQWGCGSPCKAFAILDAVTGHVWMPKIWAGLGVSYRRNSDLLIVDGPELWSEAWYPSDSAGTAASMPLYAYYYRWTQNRLQLLDSVQVRRPSAP